MTPLAADLALAAYFLEARSKILDLAAILDRVQRGDGATETAADPRLERIARALQILSADEAGKAEAVQRVFSLEYDSRWKIPEPR